MHGKVLIGSEKPTGIVALLRHLFRVTTVENGCGGLSLNVTVQKRHQLTSVRFFPKPIDVRCPAAPRTKSCGNLIFLGLNIGKIVLMPVDVGDLPGLYPRPIRLAREDELFQETKSRKRICKERHCYS